MSPARSSSWSRIPPRWTRNVAKPDDMIDCQGGQITLAGRMIHDDKSDRGMRRGSGCHGACSVPATWPPSSSRSRSARTASINTFAPSALVSAPAWSCPAKRAACCAPSIAGTARRSAPSPSARKSASRRATGLDGFDHRQRRHVSAAAHSHAEPSTPTARTRRLAAPQRLQSRRCRLKPGEDLPNPLPLRRASRHFRDGRGPDAQDDGGRRPLRHRQAGAAQRLLLRRQNRHRAKDRSCHAPLFEDDAHRIVRWLCAGQQSCHRRRRRHRLAQGRIYYGTAVSAPVFAEVAQQVLEYLGVPHDIDLQQPRPPRRKPKRSSWPKTMSDADQDQVNALYAAANDLPTDDPLRARPHLPKQAPQPRVASAQTPSADALREARAVCHARRKRPTRIPRHSRGRRSSSTIHDGKQLTVPSLVGLPVRQVIEAAAAAGLEVEITGSGTAREQAPAPGTHGPASEQKSWSTARH